MYLWKKAEEEKSNELEVERERERNVQKPEFGFNIVAISHSFVALGTRTCVRVCTFVCLPMNFLLMRCFNLVRLLCSVHMCAVGHLFLQFSGAIAERECNRMFISSSSSFA